MTEVEGTVTGSQSLYPPGSPSGEVGPSVVMEMQLCCVCVRDGKSGMLG